MEFRGALDSVHRIKQICGQVFRYAVATGRTDRDVTLEHQPLQAVKDANGTAYNRMAHLPARRVMVLTWADYLDKLRTGADLIQFKAT
jgi:hypothetical protein